MATNSKKFHCSYKRVLHETKKLDLSGTTSLTIKEVGKESGFDNVCTFGRVYIKYEATIPSHFRENLQ